MPGNSILTRRNFTLFPAPPKLDSMHSWEGDSRLKATPDYGSMGPASDLPSPGSTKPRGNPRVLIAVAAGAMLGLAFVSGGTVQAAWTEISQFLSLQGKPEPASPRDHVRTRT